MLETTARAWRFCFQGSLLLCQLAVQLRDLRLIAGDIPRILADGPHLRYEAAAGVLIPDVRQLKTVVLRQAQFVLLVCQAADGRDRSVDLLDLLQTGSLPLKGDAVVAVDALRVTNTAGTPSDSRRGPNLLMLFFLLFLGAPGRMPASGGQAGGIAWRRAKKRGKYPRKKRARFRVLRAQGRSIPLYGASSRRMKYPWSCWQTGQSLGASVPSNMWPQFRHIQPHLVSETNSFPAFSRSTR